MSKLVRINNFTLAISEGYPHWVQIMHKNEVILHNLHHEELKDLEYAMARARALVKKDLQPDNKDEA